MDHPGTWADLTKPENRPKLALSFLEYLNNREVSVAVDTAGQLVATGPATALTGEVKQLLKKYKPDLIQHLATRWVGAEITRAAFDAAAQCGYWPASTVLEHPTRGQVNYPEPALLLDATLDGAGLEMPDLPIVGPGPVVQYGPVQLVLVVGIVEVYSPYNKDFVDDLKGMIPYAARKFNDMLKCWEVDQVYRTGLADLIRSYYHIDFLPGIEAILEEAEL